MEYMKFNPVNDDDDDDGDDEDDDDELLWRDNLSSFM